MRATGRTRYRVGFLGKIILQVEESYRCIPGGARCSPSNFITRNKWRDATSTDVFIGMITVAPSSDDEAAA